MAERAAPVVHSPRTPDPRAAGAPAHDAGQAAAEGPGADGLLLSRRVPQAHLAPELRRSGAGQAPATPRPDGPPPDAAEARAALSRYQASRQAARAAVDEGAGEADPGRPAGGWT